MTNFIALLILACLFAVPAQAVPRRLVSLSPVTTEMCYELGLAPQLVGVTEDCDYPPAAKQKAKVGKFGTVNLERLVLLKPDLILATQDMAPRLAAVTRLGIPLVKFQTPNLPAIAHNMRELGRVTGRQSKAEAWSQDWNQRLRRLERPVSSQSALFVLWAQPVVTASQTSFIGDLIRRAGLRNPVQTRDPFPQIGWEQLIGFRPDWVITTLADRKSLQGGRWTNLPAVRAGRLIQLNPDWVERPGPRALLGLKQLVEALP